MTSQYGACALNTGQAKLHARARTHSRTHRTHREICNTYCFSKATIICKRASVVRYTYIVGTLRKMDALRSSETSITNDHSTQPLYPRRLLFPMITLNRIKWALFAKAAQCV